MNLDLDRLQESLCRSFCANIRLRRRSEELFSVETPFYFSDGDPYQIYLKEMPAGIIRISDMGHTIMQLSYSFDIDSIYLGSRGQIFNAIKSELDISEENGELYIDSTSEELSSKILKFGQAITKVTDLNFLSRTRVANTFYDDLKEMLYKKIPSEKIIENYLHDGIDNPANYPVDYRLDGKGMPIFLFGIGEVNKAKLVTIILEHMLRQGVDFESSIIFSKIDEIPDRDLARLIDVSDDIITSISQPDTFERKVLRKVV